MLTYDKNFILIIIQHREKLQFCEMDALNFNVTVNTYSYIEILSTSVINPALINPPNLQYLLFDIKDQLWSHPWLVLPENIKSGIWSYYKF